MLSPVTLVVAQPATHPVVKTVNLGRPVADSPDFPWGRTFPPTHPEGLLDVSEHYIEPHELHVRMPSGRVLQTRSRFTWVNQFEGDVSIVFFVPDVEPSPLDGQLDLLERMATEWGVDLHPRAKESLAEARRTLGDSRGGSGSYEVGGGRLHDGSGEVGFRPRAGDAGWWLDVAVVLPREAAAGPGPATRPAATQPVRVR